MVTNRTLRILLVEDSVEDMMFVEHALITYGLDVTLGRVDTAAELQAHLAEASWDAVVSDFYLPGFGAEQALTLVRQHDPEMPFVAISGLVGEETAVRLMRAGAHDFVMKDKMARLAPALERALHSARSARERRQAEQELRESRAQLRALSTYLQTLREEEQTRIARELHDELGQVLTALKMDVTMCDLQYSSQTPGLAERLESMKKLIDHSMDSVRMVATSLRPPVLETGIVSALEWVVGEFCRRNPIQCSLDIQQDVRDMHEQHGVVLFRVVQEALTNITRHAAAKNVQVVFGQEGGNWCLDIHDDGIGLANKPAGKKSFGLIGMRERVLAVCGSLNLDSEPGLGTRLSVRIPCDHVPADGMAPFYLSGNNADD